MVENLGSVTTMTPCHTIVRFIIYPEFQEECYMYSVNKEWNPTSDTMLWQHASITKLKINATF